MRINFTGFAPDVKSGRRTHVPNSSGTPRNDKFYIVLYQTEEF